MFASSIITFRETLEAALVVGIIFSYLTKTRQLYFKKFVLRGIGGGVLISIIVAFLLDAFFGGLPEGRPEQLFEGILMGVTAGFLTWMILWVHRQKEQAEHIRRKVSRHIQNEFGFGIFLLSLTSVSREGIEAVLYLKATSLAGSQNQFLGALFGILIALFIGFLLFSFAMRIKLATIFKITSLFLLLFAAGLVSHGVHEFQEAGILPIFAVDPLFNISHILSNDSIIGGVLRTLFGYTSKPTILEISSYASYLIGIIFLQRLVDRLLVKRS